jgi:hypothetical protein
MDEEEHELLESAEKGVKENYMVARNYLKKYFRTIYENEGMEWTEENNKEIDFIVEAIKNRAVFQSIKTVRDTMRSGKLK